MARHVVFPETGLREIQRRADVTIAKSVDKSRPPSQQFQSLTAKSRRFHPHPPAPCHTQCAPAAGWIANASVQVGGRPPESRPNVWRGAGGGDGQRGSAGGALSKRRQPLPATGPGSGSCLHQADRDGTVGPGLWRTWRAVRARVRAGICA